MRKIALIIVAMLALPLVEAAPLYEPLPKDVIQSGALLEAAWQPAFGVWNESIMGRASVFTIEPVNRDMHYAVKDCPARTFIVANVTTIEANNNEAFVVQGHGLQTSGVLCGTGTKAEGYYAGIAPGAHLVSYSDGQGALGDPSAQMALHSEFEPKVLVHAHSTPPAWHYRPLEYGVDIVVAASAGNDGESEGKDGSQQQTFAWAGTDPRILLVGATKWDGSEVAAYSSRGKIGEPSTYPMIMAPGCQLAPLPPQLYSLDNTINKWAFSMLAEDENCPPEFADVPALIELYRTQQYGMFGGTSAAAPIVAGVLAMMYEVNPVMDNQTAIYLVTRTADPMKSLPANDTDGDGRVNPEEFFEQWGWQAGYGLVNATAAVAAANWLALHPGATPQEAVACFTVDHDKDGRLVLNADDPCRKERVSVDVPLVEDGPSSSPASAAEPAGPTIENVSTPVPAWIALVAALFVAVSRRRSLRRLDSPGDRNAY